MKTMVVRLAIVSAMATVFVILAIVTNPACIDADTDVAAKVYENCLSHTWASQQCRRTVSEVSCRKWSFWVWSRS